jgi:hypothetical protein
VEYTALVLLRFILYYPKNQHFFLLDLCYFGNWAVVAYLWFFPDSELLFMAIYMLAHGPLLAATIMFNNKVVFHSWDKVRHVVCSANVRLECPTLTTFTPLDADHVVRCALTAGSRHIRPALVARGDGPWDLQGDELSHVPRGGTRERQVQHIQAVLAARSVHCDPLGVETVDMQGELYSPYTIHARLLICKVSYTPHTLYTRDC